MGVLDSLFRAAHGAGADSVAILVLNLLIGFIIGQASAWCYKWTHRGVSYSRTFTQALILITMLSALTMSMVMRNPIVAFGLLGGLAIIRFRTVVRDARDTAYILLCLVCGMAAGFGYYVAAIVGALAANGVAMYLYQTGFGSWRSLNSLLRFQVEAPALDSTRFNALLDRHCRSFSVVSVDEAAIAGPADARRYQCAYTLRLRNPDSAADLVAELRETFQVDTVHLLVEPEHEDVT